MNTCVMQARLDPLEEYEMDRFEGRVAVVTGAARGIGAAIARRLAEEGAAVAVLDLEESAATATAGSLPGRAIGIGADVSDAPAVDAAVGRVADQFGRLDILVNNAGVTRDSLLFKMSEDDWDLVIRVHLRGGFLMSRAAQRLMTAQKYGRIVNLSSISALGRRGQANYSAAKMGIQGFTRTLAVELGPYGVTVNAVAPGFVVTEMTDEAARRQGLEPEELQAARAERNPVRRVGVPADIAAAVAFLASDEASYITGQTLYVDGGGSVA